jgi:type II secretory pathway pseudopilin PulG
VLVSPRARIARRASSGFTLVEMIVVTLLLMIAMLGLLAVFDASARINKNETDVADAQGSVRYGIYQMTRVIRMAGSGGLFVTQAVLNKADSGLSGITPLTAVYDNVTGVTVTPTTGAPIPVRNGTDMLEIRGVIQSPLLGFDLKGGCAGCTGTQDIVTENIVGDPLIGQHLNNNASRPQFAAIDTYTAGVTAALPMFVIVSASNVDLHPGCSDPNPGGAERFPQLLYNVGLLTSQTNLLGSPAHFPSVDFGNARAIELNPELPATAGSTAQPINNVRRAGVLDDFLFFIGTDPVVDPGAVHPFLAQGIRRGDKFEVSRIAEDVEDMQVAYGIDANDDGSVTRDLACSAISPLDPDPNYSTVAGCDEWSPNVNGEAAPVATDFIRPGTPDAHCPRLHAVWVSLLAKARDSDPTYRAPAASGYHIMNSTATPITGRFRRRVQNMRVNLRNYDS